MTREETGGDGISRRTLIAGSAWAVPVVALTAATPLAAASQALAGCGTDYRLTAANPQGVFVENTSSTAQVVTLVFLRARCDHGHAHGDRRYVRAHPADVHIRIARRAGRLSRAVAR